MISLKHKQDSLMRGVLQFAHIRKELMYNAIANKLLYCFILYFINNVMNNNLWNHERIDTWWWCQFVLLYFPCGPRSLEGKKITNFTAFQKYLSWSCCVMQPAKRHAYAQTGDNVFTPVERELVFDVVSFYTSSTSDLFASKLWFHSVVKLFELIFCQ